MIITRLACNIYSNFIRGLRKFGATKIYYGIDTLGIS